MFEEGTGRKEGAATGNSRNEDEAFKDCIRRPDVLSNLLGGWIEELKGKSPEEIRSCLDIGEDGRVQSVDPKLFIGGTYIELDNFFRVRLPNRDEVGLYICIEGQNRTNPGYGLDRRLDIYVARMLMEQLNALGKVEYHHLKRCYAIMILFKPNKKESNRVVRYRYAKIQEGTSSAIVDGRHSLSEIIEVYLPRHDDDTPDPTMEILKLLFNSHPDPKENSDKLA